MTEKEKPSKALDIIFHWSEDRPLWIRDAIRRIIESGLPTANSISELSEICMSTHGLCEGPTANPLSKDDIGSGKEAKQAAQLLCISDVSGVNQLAVGQTVKFGSEGLTVIYGQNGSGKSGYSRILKRACNARHRGEIMPDAFSESTKTPACAKIGVQQDSKTHYVDWKDEGEQPSELRAITIFDRECASVHLNQKNPVLFRPFGLDVPDDLVTVCSNVKSILEDRKKQTEQRRDPVFQDPIWTNTSDIGEFLSTLNGKTDPKSFPSHADLTPEEVARLAQLQADLNTDPTKAAASHQRNAASIRRLAQALSGLSRQLDDEASQDFEQMRSKASESRAIAKVAAEKAFSNLDLSNVGEPVWQGLWEAASRFSEIQADTKSQFPPSEGQSCVLCHQSISADAARRMSGFEAFIRDDTEAVAQEAERQFEERFEVTRNLRIETRSLSAEIAVLSSNDAATAKQVRRYLAGLRLRRRGLTQKETTTADLPLPPLPELPTVNLNRVAEKLESYANSLLAESGSSARNTLVAEYNQLKDRSQQERLRAIATAEIKRLSGQQAIEACISECTTTAITRLGNEIADKTITPAMRDRFQSEIIKLAADRVRVEIVRTGGKAGSPQYEVKFFANSKAKVANILSEGEQTCVALAAHLTELTNEDSGSALVFDDPVTSLDHRWRRKVAERLVEEAGKRQVVVFTHDLIFVNDLHDLASESSVSTHLGTLERTAKGCGVYSDNLPWRAAKIKERVDQMEKEARAAQKLYDTNDEEAYRKAIVGLYGELRAAWERGLEDRVFAGVIMRHRDYLNTKQLKRVAALGMDDVAVFEANFKKCCDFLEAHDPSRGRDGDVPPPAEVFADIKVLLDWDDALRKKQNDLDKGSDKGLGPQIRVVQ